MKLCVIFNPAAKGDKARRFRRHLEEIAAEAALRPTTAPGAGRRLAAAAVAEGFDRLIAAGGDGTLNEVLNGIADVPGGLERVQLGVLPLGTANVFARELGMPLRWNRAWRAILEGQEQTLDLVRVEQGTEAGRVSRYFVQMAGAGLDARATELVDWSWKKKTGFFAYIAAGLRALREVQPQITVHTETQELTGELVLLGNGQRYGGPFRLFADADPRDGRLDIRVFPKANPRLALTCALGILTGRVGRVGGSVDLQVEQVTLTADRRTPLQIDGEHIGELPAEFRVLPRALRVIAGPAYFSTTR